MKRTFIVYRQQSGFFSVLLEDGPAHTTHTHTLVLLFCPTEEPERSILIHPTLCGSKARIMTWPYDGVQCWRLGKPAPSPAIKSLRLAAVADDMACGDLFPAKLKGICDSQAAFYTALFPMMAGV